MVVCYYQVKTWTHSVILVPRKGTVKFFFQWISTLGHILRLTMFLEFEILPFNMWKSQKSFWKVRPTFFEKWDQFFWNVRPVFWKVRPVFWNVRPFFLNVRPLFWKVRRFFMKNTVPLFKCLFKYMVQVLTDLWFRSDQSMPVILGNIDICMKNPKAEGCTNVYGWV